MSRHVRIPLPEWLDQEQDALPRLASMQQRMRYTVDLARRSIEQSTGGPFAATIVESISGQVVCAGVNLVVMSGVSVAHAEVVAIGLANGLRGSYDLADPGLPSLELVTSVEPCAMCIGAVLWSGVSRVVCGAPSSAAEAIGFDEGPRADDWVQQMRSRGVEVVQGVLAAQAAEVLRSYADSGGPIYSPRR